MNDAVIDIDPDTGLPRLPEGYFYRVSEYEVSIMEDRGPGPWMSSMPSWYEHSGEVESRQVMGEMNDWHRPWYMFGFRRHYKYEVPRTQYRSTRETMMVARYSEDVITGDHLPLRSAGEGGHWVEVNKDNLISMAEVARLRWESAKEVSKLIGDYPPKKFER